MGAKEIERKKEIELEAALAKTQTPIEHINAQNALSDHIYLNEHILDTDISHAMELAQSAEKSARIEKYNEGLAMALFMQGVIYYTYRLDNDAALRCYYAALQILDSLDAQRLQARVLRKIAQVYNSLAEWGQALDYLLKAVARSEACGDIEDQGMAIFQIGVTYSESGDSRQAIESYLRAIELLTLIQQTHKLGIVYNSCCVDYTILGEYDLAQKSGEKALQLFAQTGGIYNAGVAQSSLGEIALAKHDFAGAIQQFEQALAKFAEGKPGELGTLVLGTQLHLSQAYYALGDIERALHYVEICLAPADQQEEPEIFAKIHDQLAKIYESQGNLAAALHHIKQYIAVKESYLNEESQRELHNLQIVHQTNEAMAEGERQRNLREQDRHYFQRLAQIKEEFVHNATHDIKNPVRVINQATSLLQEKLPAEDATTRQQLNTITHQSQRIMHLVEDVLELARLESVPAIHTEPVAVMTWLAEFVDGFEPLAAAKAIDLSMEVHPLDLTCELNKYRLEQAIGNLVSNALQYTRHGGRVQLYAAKNDDQIQIQIIDNGVGIPADSIEHVFERFYRVENPIVDEMDGHEMDGHEIDGAIIEGTGLGLSVAKLGVEQHGGTIEVDSAVGQGTTFTIMLPL